MLRSADSLCVSAPLRFNFRSSCLGTRFSNDRRDLQRGRENRDGEEAVRSDPETLQYLARWRALLIEPPVVSEYINRESDVR